MLQRLRFLLVCVTCAFCFVQARSAHAQATTPAASAPETNPAPTKFTLHPMTAGQQVRLFGAGLVGAGIGGLAALGTGALVAAAYDCGSCNDEDDAFAAAGAAGIAVVVTAVIAIPLATSIAQNTASRRMGYQTHMGKSLGGALLGIGVATGVDLGVASLMMRTDASTGAIVGTTLGLGFVIIAASASLFHRLEQKPVQAVPTLAPTAQGGFTAGVAGRF
jgi:hypothetical protein